MKLLLLTACFALLSAHDAKAQYNIPSARVYACTFCVDENPEYDLCHANTCLHFVSQVLQHGCMGICDGYFCKEFTDPASTDPPTACGGNSRCVRCDPAYAHDGKPFTMTNNSGGGIPFFQESQFWNIEGPFTPFQFRTSPPPGWGPIHRPHHGDVVLYREEPASCEGHAMWIAEDEDAPGGDQYWLQVLYAANNNSSCPPFEFQQICFHPSYINWLRTHIEWLESVHPAAEVFIAWPTGAPGRQPQSNPNPPQGRWQSEDNPHVVTDNIVVQVGTQLSMEPGVEVVFGESVGITVEPGAVLRLDGTPSAPITLRSSTANVSWGGVVVESEESFSHLYNVDIQDASIGLVINGGNISAQNVSITNCDIGAAVIGGTVNFENIIASNNERCGAYVIGSNANFKNCEFSENGKGGIRIWHAPNCELENCEIVDNGSLWSPPNDAFWSGVQVLQGGLTLKCNKIAGNYGPGLSLFSVTYADLGENVGRNIIEDNMQILGPSYSYDDGQILLGGGIVNMECGLNTIRDAANSNMLVRSLYDHVPATGWNAVYNYWGTTDANNIAPRLDNEPEFEPIAERVWDCQEIVVPPCEDTPEELLFRSAWQLEREAQFNQALANYELYLDQYPQGKHEDVVVDRILFCKDALKYSWLDIRNYFLDLAADSSKDSNVVVLCKSNAAWCLAEMGDYEGAYFELDSLLDHTTTEYMQLTMELKLLLLELQQDEIALAFDNSKKQDLSHLDNRPQEVVSKLINIDSQLDQLLQSSSATRKRPGSSPSAVSYDFNLYSNYPNPFNSSTRIRFSLPSDGPTTLRVYDVTGRLVTTLLDDVVTAGHHQVDFDGANLSSGVYFCQLLTGMNRETKKMVLMK